MRSDAPERLTPAGWKALVAHGVRTIVDLRDEHEVGRGLAAPPGIATARVPLDPVDDADFWGRWGRGLHATPLYYRPFLERFPDRAARAVRAVARARPGGVLVHCGVGRDRTGLLVLVMLAAAGVEPEAIADDYALSEPRLGALYTALGEPDQGPAIAAAVARAGTSTRAAVLDTLDWLDADAYLRAAGVPAGELAALRERLLEP